MSTPGRVELDQPGRGRVTDGGLQAGAAQDHQWVLLRVQLACGAQAPGEEPEDQPRFEAGAEHPAVGSERGRCQKLGGFAPTSADDRGDISAAANNYVLRVFTRAGSNRLLTLTYFRSAKSACSSKIFYKRSMNKQL